MKSYDMLVQAETGLAAITGGTDAPGRVGVSVCDIAAGMYAHQAILEALIRRGRTGKGAAIAVSLFDGMADWMAVPLLQYDYGGSAPPRSGSCTRPWHPTRRSRPGTARRSSSRSGTSANGRGSAWRSSTTPHNTFGALAVPLLPAIVIAALGSRWILPVAARGETARGGFVDLLKIKGLRDALLASGIVSSAWDVYQFFMPVYGHAQGLSATAIGVVMSAFGISIILVRMVVPFAVHRYGEAQLLTAAMFVACVAFALFPLFRSAWPLAAVSFLLGIGCGCGQPLSMTLLFNASPKGRAGEATGMRIMVNQIGHVAIPLLFGALRDIRCACNCARIS